MRYYTIERLLTPNGDLPPIDYEQNSLRKGPDLVAQNINH